jgi:hypothetical protein
MSELGIERPGFATHYLAFGYWLGALVGIVTFFGCYIYCIVSYGFLFGLGLGWLPSGIVAIAAFAATMFLWAPAMVVLPVLLAEIMK